MRLPRLYFNIEQKEYEQTNTKWLGNFINHIHTHSFVSRPLCLQITTLRGFNETSTTNCILIETTSVYLFAVYVFYLHICVMCIYICIHIMLIRILLHSRYLLCRYLSVRNFIGPIFLNGLVGITISYSYTSLNLVAWNL